jgi:hypothetical protein
MELKTINDVQKGIDDAIAKSLPLKQQALKQLEKIINTMPSEVSYFINEAYVIQRIPKEYLLSSTLFAFSNAAGLAFKVSALGYENYGNLYFAIVGSRGDVKSLAIDLATDPLNDYDSKCYEEFENQIDTDGQEKCPRQQLFLQDSTIESAVFVHNKNRYSVGMLNDELSGLIQKMANKSSNEGAMWRVFFLQGYTNKHIDISRKTTDSFRIKKSYPTLLGSLQNEFIPKLFADGNLESGFIDRLLFTTKLTENKTLSRKKMSELTKQNYNVLLTNILNERKFIENECERFSTQLTLTDEADTRLFDYLQELTNKREKLGNILMQYNAKMQISIHKLLILAHLILNAKNDVLNELIAVETVDLAILINEFYFTNFQIIVEENLEQSKKDPSLDEIIKVAQKNGAKQDDVVQITGKDKSTVSRRWNKIIQQQPAT